MKCEVWEQIGARAQEWNRNKRGSRAGQGGRAGKTEGNCKPDLPKIDKMRPWLLLFWISTLSTGNCKVGQCIIIVTSKLRETFFVQHIKELKKRKRGEIQGVSGSYYRFWVECSVLA